MAKIPTHLFKPKTGSIVFYPGDEGELGFDLNIPLHPFNSGLSYVKKLEKTEFILERNFLSAGSIDELDGRTFKISKGPPDNDGSIYIGNAHNPVDLKSISFKRHDAKHFDIEVSLDCQFDYEGVGDNEKVKLSATVRIHKAKD